jgi:dsDNA-specific endonuclease/ATPase MutS2
LEDFLRKEYTLRRYKMLREIALKLNELKRSVEEAVKTLLDFDLFFAVGLFAKDYSLNVPNLSEEYVGIGFTKGRNLFLRELELKSKIKVIPVDYVVGDVSIQPPNTNKERIIVLSGANSGGKTTLLNLIAQIVILAQMGFPVPADEVYLCPFDEIYLFSRSRGIMDAGAFEATLKNFAKVITSPKKKLVLVDELEAITEPGAAAKVIAGILELLYSSKNTCAVFISHLAEEVMKVVKVPIRVDGIEASGLDENLNLIVNRNPIYNYLARSTPELIVERLYRLSKGSEKEVYEKLLEEFGGK